MEDKPRPVFYDETGRRWAWARRLLGAGGLLLLGLLCVFVASVIGAPLLVHSRLPKPPPPWEGANPGPAANGRQVALPSGVDQHLSRRQRRALARAERQDRLAVRREYGKEKARPRTAPGGAPSLGARPVVAAFYVNWEESSYGSLAAHIDRITHFLPGWLHLTGAAPYFLDQRDREDRMEVEPLVRAHHVPILPVIDNYVPDRPESEQGRWDAGLVHALLSDPPRREALVDQLTAWVVAQQWQGINIDFEQVPAADRDKLTLFMQDLHDAFAPEGLLVTQDIPLADPAYDLPRLALASDALLPMLYDQHSPGEASGPGSIAGLEWTRQSLAAFFKQVPANRTVLAVGNYAYDWKLGETRAASLNYQEAVLQARESADPDDPSIARLKLDPQSLNPSYDYYADDGRHRVWLLDAITTYNQWQVAKPYYPRGIALWYLGSEDPGIWEFLDPERLFADHGPAIRTGALNTVSYGRQSAVDFQGEGEMLALVAQPADGHRTVTCDPHTGLLTGETYSDYPSEYVVRRYGHQPKSIVLTFDDGPDPRWTPQILDILSREHVPATFFIVGEQAQRYPDLVWREWHEGHELGNHTLSHPNLALHGPQRTLLEITTTQRILESITGHSTALFRPPYSMDIEPRTGSELQALVVAATYGLIAVGEANDPQDWNLGLVGSGGKQGADRIVESVWQDRDQGDVVLLHDAGGDRSATVAALPRLIERLHAGGYSFITLAQMRGVPRDTLFPAVPAHDRLLVTADRLALTGERWLSQLLVLLFSLSILLSVTRQFWMGALALLQHRAERRRNAALGPLGSAPFLPVSVVIACFNEEKVILQTLQAVLASTYPGLDVVVVDDGSTDRTYEVVTDMYAEEPRVRCFRKPNGGKASALNLGLQHARGEVIVAQDADTLLAPEAIARLARHFADSRVGAVCGNVRVGNAHNLLTKWQSLEYITSQNFDRRAYDLLNCITVVPGAAGAWRREAVLGVGGYPTDTLAEDTDLTWTIRRAGWRVLNDSTAVAYTEAPETLSTLARQRFRWTFGTLQNLWKHLSGLFRNGAFGWIALPSLWVYQVVFPAISPIMDVMIVWAIVRGEFRQFAVYYAAMVGAEFLGAALALWMDRGNWGLLPWLFVQKLVYRQLIYFVILKSILAALRGGSVRWGKLDRRGTAQLGAERPAA